MRLLGLFWMIVYFLYICMVLLRLLVLCDLCLFLSTYVISFSPLKIGYRATRILDSGWIENFGGQGMY